MRAWTLLILAMLGCGQAPAPEAPVDDIDAAYQRVVNPVPPPPEESPLGSAVESYLDAAAADAESPRVNVTMLTATWCGPCKNAKAKVVPWLMDQGYVVDIVDVGDGHDLQDGYGVSALPAFVFTLGDKSTAVVGPRYDTKGNPYAPDFAKALKEFPPPLKDANAVSFGMSVPAISVADLTESVAGMDQDLFGVVHVTVPKDVSWDVKHLPSSVLLTFKPGKQPSLRSLKYVRANPNLISVEISPKYAEFKTDSYWPMLRSVRVDFDWAPPATKTPVKKTAGNYARFRQQPYRYQPVPQRPAPPVVKAESEPTPAPPPPVEPLSINPNPAVAPHLTKAWLSSVAITTLKHSDRGSIFGYSVPQSIEGYGSGFVIRSDGYILTNNHVVEGCHTVKVTFCNGQERHCKVVNADAKVDIAVVKVEETGLAVMPIANLKSQSLRAGDDVHVLGNPYGFNSSLSRGIISNLSRTVDCGDDLKYEGLLQSDASINPGNSGGAMLNAKGEAVGVCVAMRAGALKIGFAIPIERAMEAANRMVKP